MANITVTSVDSVITANTTTDVINVTTQTSNVIVSATNISDISLSNITTPIVSNSNITTTANIQSNYSIANTFVGDLIGDVTGNVTGQVSDISNFTTDDLAEGNTNLYYTDARARASISSTGNINYDANTGVISENLTTTDIAEGDNLYYTNARVNAYVIDAGLDFNAEKVDDRVANLMQTSGNLTFTYNDSANTLTLSQSLTTDDITEGDNLYFTSDRANSNVVAHYASGSVTSPILTSGNISSNANIDLRSTQPAKIILDTSSLVTDPNDGSYIGVTDGLGDGRIRFGNYDGSNVSRTVGELKYRQNDETFLLLANTTTVITARSNLIQLNADEIDLLGNVDFSGDLEVSGTANITGNVNSGPLYVTGDSTIVGNLEVQGNIDYVNVVDMLVDDNSITLNYGNASPRDAFIYVDRSGGALNNAHLKWNETDDRWEIYDGTSTYILPRSTTDLAEGTNLYFTSDRANSNVEAYYASGVSGSDIITNGALQGANVYLSGIYSRYASNIANSNITISALDDNANSTVIDNENLGRLNLYRDLTYGTSYISLSNTTDDSYQIDLQAGLRQPGANILADDPYFITMNKRGLLMGRGGNGYGGALNTKAIWITDSIGLYYNVTISNATLTSNSDISTTANMSATWFVGNVDGQVNDISNFTTTDLTEGANLYYTTDRANSAIENYVSGSGNINFANGVISESLTTTDIDEGDNLYYTDARARAAISATGNINYDANTGVISESLTTTDIDEGDNLYFTTDRANSAIDDYVVGSENIDVSSGVISLANVLSNVNQINAEANTALTLQGFKINIQSEVDSGADSYENVINVSTTGYSVTAASPDTEHLNSLNNNASYGFLIGAGSPVFGSVPAYSTTEGSNVITVNPGAYILRNDTFGFIGGDISVVQEYMTTFINLAKLTLWEFSPTAYVTNVSSSGAFAGGTITMSEPARANTAGTAFGINHGGVDLTTGQTFYYTGASSNEISIIAQKYNYPQEGWSNTNFTYSIAQSNASFTGGFTSQSTRQIADLESGNGAIRFNRALAIGDGALPSAQSSATDSSPSILGINIVNDGLTDLSDASNRQPFQQLSLIQYSNNSAYTSTESSLTQQEKDSAGPKVKFSYRHGDENSNFLDKWVRANVHIGKIVVQGGSQDDQSLSEYVFPAGITFRAEEDWTDNRNTGVYFQNTPKESPQPITGPRTWMAGVDGNVQIQTSPNGQFIVSPFDDFSNATVGAYEHNLRTDHQFLTAGYNDTVNKTGTIVNIQAASGNTNGSYSTVGDAVLAIKTHDDAGNVSTEWLITNEQSSGNLILSQNLNDRVEFATDGVYVNGNVNLNTNSAINYDVVYGCFHNDANVTAANANTVYSFEWPVTHVGTNRVTVASNTQITIAKTGAYAFDLEMQAENADNQDRTAYIWLAKNGTDIANTTVRVSLLKEWKQVIVKQWLVEDITSGDYVEVKFAVDNTSGIQLTALPSQASPYARPAVPSAVLTVKPIGA